MCDTAISQQQRVIDYLSVKENYARLVLHTAKEARKYRWFSSSSRSISGGNSPEDIVNGLIEQLLETDPLSSRRRNIPADVEIGVAFRWHVRSRLSALARSWENRNFVRGVELSKEEQDGPPSEFDLGGPMWDKPDSEEASAATTARLSRFHAFLSNDKLLHAILGAWLTDNHPHSAEVLAQRLDVTVNDIYIEKKRMKSALRRFQQTEKI